MTPTEEILKAYEQTNSIDGAQKATGFSWQRIAKTLASNGIIANETQALIIGLYEGGKSMEEIQNVQDLLWQQSMLTFQESDLLTEKISPKMQKE
mgnify:CR=1 FL=1